MDAVRYENFEKYDMLSCYIQSNEIASQAAELYFNRYLNSLDYFTQYDILLLFRFFNLDILKEDSQILKYLLDLNLI